MKRFWIMLLVVAVAIVITLPAGAAPPCSANPNHPECIPEDPVDPPPDEPLVGLTCAEAAIEYGFDHVAVVWNTDGTEFTVKLGARQDACVDVMAGAGPWIVGGDFGTALEVSMGVQDSVAPGDACWGGCAGGGTFTNDGPFTDFGDTFVMPESTLNACDDDLMDPDFGDNDPALTFSASAAFRGDPKKAVAATITVKVPKFEPTP